MKVFIKDFCETVQARVVIFGMQVDNDVLWDRKPAFSCLFFSVFVRFSFFPYYNNDFFDKDICEIVQAGVVIFSMQVDNDVLYGGIANQPSDAYSSLYLSNFLPFHTLNNESFHQRFL